MEAVSHEEVIPQLAQHLRPLFDSSPDGGYVWLDEQHSACNENMAKMFGLTVDEWAHTPGFMQHFVREEDQGLFSWNYWNRVQPKIFPVTFRFRGIGKDRQGRLHVRCGNRHDPPDLRRSHGRLPFRPTGGGIGDG